MTEKATALTATRTQVDEAVAQAVREGLTAQPKRLPPWLFYDEAGSRLFEEITELPDYYVTRTERDILTACSGAMIAQAAQGKRVRAGGAGRRVGGQDAVAAGRGGRASRQGCFTSRWTFQPVP